MIVCAVYVVGGGADSSMDLLSMLQRQEAGRSGANLPGMIEFPVSVIIGCLKAGCKADNSTGNSP